MAGDTNYVAHGTIRECLWLLHWRLAGALLGEAPDRDLRIEGRRRRRRRAHRLHPTIWISLLCSVTSRMQSRW